MKFLKIHFLLQMMGKKSHTRKQVNEGWSFGEKLFIQLDKKSAKQRQHILTAIQQVRDLYDAQYESYYSYRIGVKMICIEYLSCI